jgi:hypothetical protein
MAALLQSRDDLPPVLASFYALGAARNGWLVQGSLPGEAHQDRQRLVDAGLDVDALQAAARLSIVELDLTLSPDRWVDRWSEILDARLGAGFKAVWFARFPIGPTDEEVDAVLPFEAAWMDRFRDRPMVTLCPYIVPGTDAAEPHPRVEALQTVHDDVIDFRQP